MMTARSFFPDCIEGRARSLGAPGMLPRTAPRSVPTLLRCALANRLEKIGMGSLEVFA